MNRVRVAALMLLALSACGDNAKELTIPEQATEACRSEEVRAEFSNGHTDFCFGIMVNEIASANGYHLDTWEDGSGVLYTSEYQEIATFQEDTFLWDCKTMGNKICGPQPATELPRTS